jgi:hypothetical protein
MELDLGYLLFGASAIVVAVFILPRFLGSGSIICTRCEGTGQIDERWPDPSKPTGFHLATGTCPKCKGKGRIKP